MSDDMHQGPNAGDLADQLEEILDEDDPADINLDDVKRVVGKMPQTTRTRRLTDIIDGARQRGQMTNATDLDEIIGSGNAVIDEIRGDNE